MYSYGMFSSVVAGRVGSRNSQHLTPTPTPGNFDFPTPTPNPTSSCISYSNW